MLGCDKDSTIGTFVTIKGCGCSVLKDAYALDIVGNYIVDITLHSINEDERRATAETLQATYVEGWVGYGIKTGTLQRNETIALSDDAVADRKSSIVLPVAL